MHIYIYIYIHVIHVIHVMCLCVCIYIYMYILYLAICVSRYLCIWYSNMIMLLWATKHLINMKWLRCNICQDLGRSALHSSHTRFGSA